MSISLSLSAELDGLHGPDSIKTFDQQSNGCIDKYVPSSLTGGALHGQVFQEFCKTDTTESHAA